MLRIKLKTNMGAGPKSKPALKRFITLTGKRGISPLIATVILIGISIVIFGVIFSWMRGMVSEQVQKFGVNIETQCQKVAFSARIEGNNIYMDNKGNIPIVGVNLKIKSGGKTITKNVLKPLDGVISPGEIDVIAVDDTSFAEAGAKRIITPLIQGKTVKSGQMQRFLCRAKAVEL